MSPEQKTKMLQKIDTIEQHGLTYKTQTGETKTSKHFSLQPLIDQYNVYLAVYAYCYSTPPTASYDDLLRAWLNVGLEQRNLTACVMQEYCMPDPDSSFLPKPVFSKPNLTRGVNFTLLRSYWQRIFCSWNDLEVPDFEEVHDMAALDCEAIIYLDGLSNIKVMQSRDRLIHGSQLHTAANYGAAV